MLRELIKLSNSLDAKGFVKEADALDKIIKSAAEGDVDYRQFDWDDYLVSRDDPSYPSYLEDLERYLEVVEKEIALGRQEQDDEDPEWYQSMATLLTDKKDNLDKINDHNFPIKDEYDIGEAESKPARSEVPRDPKRFNRLRR